MKEWEIWIEGYSATGEHSPASFIGKALGETFDEACENFTYPEDLIREWDGLVMKHKGDKLNLDKDKDGLRRGSFRGKLPAGLDRINAKGNYSIWACQLFPTELEARASFG